MVNATERARIAAVGPYFSVTYGERPDPGGFRPLTELYGDPEVLRAWVADVQRRIGTDEVRVAASTLHLGMASRLWSVALASAAFTGGAPDLSPAQLWWRTPSAGPVELWLPTPRELPQGAAALHSTVAVENLGPLNDAVRWVCGVSPQVLRGNVASALVGALGVLLARAPRAPHPVSALVRDLLDREPLKGAGAFDADRHGTITFRRRSCCLYYRVPGGGLCGDCVLNAKVRTA